VSETTTAPRPAPSADAKPRSDCTDQQGDCTRFPYKISLSRAHVMHQNPRKAGKSSCAHKKFSWRTSAPSLLNPSRKLLGRCVDRAANDFDQLPRSYNHRPTILPVDCEVAYFCPALRWSKRECLQRSLLVIRMLTGLPAGNSTSFCPQVPLRCPPREGRARESPLAREGAYFAGDGSHCMKRSSR
jgi:hypothetical protein